MNDANIMTPPSHRKAGFSILEVFYLVVFTVIALFVLSSWITNQLKGNPHLSSSLIARGTGIYKSVFSEIADVQNELYGVNSVPFPLNKGKEQTHHLHFDNSTDYFIFLVKENVLPVNWSYFAGPDIPSAPGRYLIEDPSTAEDFTAENNAWNVVADLLIGDSGSPFLISRNLQETFLKVSLDKKDKPKVDGPPYGNEHIVVIRIGGSGEVMKKKNILWGNLNPGRNENVILRP